MRDEELVSFSPKSPKTMATREIADAAKKFSTLGVSTAVPSKSRDDKVVSQAVDAAETKK